ARIATARTHGCLGGISITAGAASSVANPRSAAEYPRGTLSLKIGLARLQSGQPDHDLGGCAVRGRRSCGLEPRPPDPWAAVRPADSRLGEHGIDPAWESRQALLLLLAGDQSAGDLLVQTALGGRQNRCLEADDRLARGRGRYLRERFARREFAVQRGFTDPEVLRRGRVVAAKSAPAESMAEERNPVALRNALLNRVRLGLGQLTRGDRGVDPVIHRRLHRRGQRAG